VDSSVLQESIEAGVMSMSVLCALGTKVNRIGVRTQAAEREAQDPALACG